MSVRRSVFWSLAGQIISTVLLFAGTVTVARLLSPAEVGIFAVGFAAAGLINILGSVGASAYVVREAKLHPGQLESAFTVSLLLYALLAMLIFAASFPLATAMSEPGVGRVLRLLALRPLLLVFEFRPAAMLQREMHFRPIAIVLLCSTVANVATSVGLALGGFSYMSIAYGFLAGGITSALGYNLLGARHIGFGLSLAHWRPLTVFGLRMLTISGMAAFVHRASELIMGRLLGLAMLGIFTRATQLWDLLYFNVYGSLTRVLFSQLSRDHRERGIIKDTYLRGMELVTALFWPAVIGIAVLARPVVYIVFGEPWLAAAGPLSLLMVSLLIAIGFGMSWELFVLKNETARQTRLEVVRALVSLTAFTIGCLFGPTGAAAGRVADCAIGFLLYFPHILRLSGASAREMLRMYGVSLSLTIGAVAPSVLVMHANAWSARTPPLALAGGIATGLAIWLALVWLLRHPWRAEIARLSAPAWRLAAGRFLSHTN